MGEPTNILQRRWEWQEDRRTDSEPGICRNNTAFLASRRSTWPSPDGSSRARCGRSIGRNAGRSRVGLRIVRQNSGIRDASATRCGGSSTVGTGRPIRGVGKPSKSGRPEGGENDNEYVLRGMMWADNCWLFCDNKERLLCMVNKNCWTWTWNPSRSRCGGRARIKLRRKRH